MEVRWNCSAVPLLVYNGTLEGVGVLEVVLQRHIVLVVMWVRLRPSTPLDAVRRRGGNLTG